MPELGTEPAEQLMAGLPARKLKIAKKEFDLLHTVFTRHDADQDGIIEKEEFVAAITQSMQEREGWEAPLAADEYHAGGMYDAIVRKRRHAQSGISLVQFMSLYFPHLPRQRIIEAIKHYTYKPPPEPPPVKTLDDVVGAREEIQGIYKILAGPDGLVEISTLEPVLARTGLSADDVREWLGEIRAETDQDSSMSKLDFRDVEEMLTPVYMAALDDEGRTSPQQISEGIRRQMEWNAELL